MFAQTGQILPTESAQTPCNSVTGSVITKTVVSKGRVECYFLFYFELLSVDETFRL
jgi:hypothetical protein